MTIVAHELKRGFTALVIWTLSLGIFIAMCIFIYPQMGNQMAEITDVFASMGSFSTAFGMDKINFGELMGFYGVECGNILGSGGALYAALLGISMLSKEEKDNTAEFLLSHPVSRSKIITEKLCAAFILITVLNLLVMVISRLSIVAIGETFDSEKFILLHLAFYVLQLQICAVCFGISAFISSGGFGLGIGIAIALYFLNIVANLTDKCEFLKYITPFAYAESSAIIQTSEIDTSYLLPGIVYGILGIALAYFVYPRKDIS